MSFLKRLFGGGKSEPEDRGVYVYVRLKRSQEIVRLRMTPGYDISQDDDGTYFARKTLIGTRKFEKADATFYFNKNFDLIEAEISMGAELADEAAYLAQEAANP